MNNNYFNLVNDSIDALVIEQRNDASSCFITDGDRYSFYDGFILSDTKLVQTICTIEFYPSSKTDKYIPRLDFKKILKSSGEVRKNIKNFIRISFNTAEEGYEEFWQMINFLKKFKDLVDTGEFDDVYRVTSDKDFIDYLNNKDKIPNAMTLLSKLDEAQLTSVEIMQSASIIKMLGEYKTQIKYFIDNKVNEKVVQNWIDEDEHIHRSKRCMIFGLEFVKHYREGGASGNRYDLLTRIGLESKERVLIELKSPSDEIFIEDKKETINEDKIDYMLSESLSRAIPQILEYKKILENKEKSDPELQKIGETDEVKIAKCIVVIGSHNDNPRWLAYFSELRRSLSSILEIWTYSDLLNKIESTIINLKN